MATVSTTIRDGFAGVGACCRGGFAHKVVLSPPTGLVTSLLVPRAYALGYMCDAATRLNQLA
jgi:hypothetical protein